MQQGLQYSVSNSFVKTADFALDNIMMKGDPFNLVYNISVKDQLPRMIRPRHVFPPSVLRQLGAGNPCKVGFQPRFPGIRGWLNYMTSKKKLLFDATVWCCIILWKESRCVGINILDSIKQHIPLLDTATCFFAGYPRDVEQINLAWQNLDE